MRGSLLVAGVVALVAGCSGGGPGTADAFDSPVGVAGDAEGEFAADVKAVDVKLEPVAEAITEVAEEAAKAVEEPIAEVADEIAPDMAAEIDEPAPETIDPGDEASASDPLDDAAPEAATETTSGTTADAPSPEEGTALPGDAADIDDASISDTPPADSGYNGIYAGLDNLKGPELVAKLCALVTTGYASVSYSAAGDLIRGEIDSFNGQVEEIYTGTWIAKGTGLNMEHTWPQSKGASAVPAKSDMFHLYASYPSFNSPRGNLAYGTVLTMDWPATYTGNAACTDAFPDHPEGCFSFRGKDAAGVEVFEPRDAHKGNVARSVFYFSLRYGTDCQLKPIGDFDADHPAITAELYKVWNLMDPPDDDERARNNRIETHQHVRNPFIDHPEFVDRIAFQ